jgi:ABC-2 type transport system ATP-binding protein
MSEEAQAPVASAPVVSAPVVLAARDLRKSYGAIEAVRGVSLQIHEGETYGLLGPNGAGKTTTISMICGLLARDGGEVTLDGTRIDVGAVAAKAGIGYVPQELAIYPDLTAKENLEFFGRLYGLRGAPLKTRVTEVLALTGLTQRANDRTDKYSGGMQRRLNIGIGLLHQPRLLLLDEPTVGVDPQSRNAILESIAALGRRGMAILYTTHYMEEAERLCDRIAIIDAGRILAEGTLADLLSRLPAPNVLAVDLETDPDPGLAGRFTTLPGVAQAGLEGRRLRLTLDDPAIRTGPVLETLSNGGLSWSHLHTERASLESVFLSLTGRSLRDA